MITIDFPKSFGLESIYTYVIHDSRTRSLRLRFNHLGQLECRKPRRYPRAMAMMFVASHRDWIIAHHPRPRPLESGEYIADYLLKIHAGSAAALPKVDHHQKVAELTLVNGILDEQSWKELAQILQIRSQAYLEAMYKQVSRDFDLSARQLKVRPLKTRWGSCSRSGVVTLNALAAQLERSLLRHVILHELAHLRYHHHQKSFYKYLSILDRRAAFNHLKLKRTPLLISSSTSPTSWAMR